MDKHLSASGGAEAILDFQPNSTISVTYHRDFGPHDELLLLELDEKLLPDVLCDRVSLRGEPNEEAVLCTQSKTYAIKFVGTSNSVFLVPPSESSPRGDDYMDCDDSSREKPSLASVLKVASGNLELLEVAPRLDKLRLLLSQNPFSFEQESQMDFTSQSGKGNSGLYSWDDLIGLIQASNVELRSALEALNAIEINGFWRIVDDKYMDSLLSTLLNNAILNDWSFDALPETDVISKLELDDGFPAQLASHCLSVYGNKVDDNARMWKLDEKRVCVQVAKRILKDGKVRMEKFMDEWRCKVPAGMQASFDMLESEVLTERIGVEIWVRPFSISSLPSTPAERFSILFKERSKWEWKDLEPFIRDLKVPGLSAEGLLLKYTRRSQPTPDVEPIFSAR
ncbi:hypothetical protein RND81_01G181800 [Saponaria officinalis]